MTGKDKDDATWHRTTVAVRPDIYRLAIGRGIDISDACNRALASLTGSEYPGRQRDESPAPPPVIIAGNGAAPRPAKGEKKTASRKANPVINADDPTAPAKAAEARALVQKSRGGEDLPSPGAAGTAPVSGEDTITARASGDAPALRGHTVPKKRPAKTEALKTFFSKKISRTGDTADCVGKDEFYELFVRFCHENRITPVPERKAVTIALKTRFALPETVTGGSPAWAGIRVK